MGRAHHGFAPDMSSTAGALPRLYPAANLGHIASSPLNHARMTPSVIVPPPSVVGPMARVSPSPHVGSIGHRLSPSHHSASIHLQPPVAHHRPRRASSVKPVAIDQCCVECCPDLRRSVSGSNRARSNAHHRRPGSVSVHSPLQPVNEAPVVRKVSGSRSRSARHCSECVR